MSAPLLGSFTADLPSAGLAESYCLCLEGRKSRADATQMHKQGKSLHCSRAVAMHPDGSSTTSNTTVSTNVLLVLGYRL